MMITIAVASVIMGIAIPNMRQFLLNNRMTGAANDMVIAFTAARAEAIKSQAQTIMCFTTNPTATLPTCNGNGTQGWVVFVDSNSDTAVNTGERIMVRHEAMPATVQLRTKPDTNAGYVAFNSAGFSKAVGLGNQLSGIVLCDSRGNNQLYGSDMSAARGIMISATGRPRVTRSITEISNATLGGCP